MEDSGGKAGLTNYLQGALPVEERAFEALPDSLRDRQGLHRGLISMQVSEDMPADAFVAVFYRNRWHSIADGDARSKLFFTLLGVLFSLQSAEVPVVQPLLTLPSAK